MRVAMCQPCKDNLTEEQHDDIMQCVIAGWQKDVDTLPWTDEKKQAHMDRYSQLQIVANSENVPVDILQKKFDIYKQEVKNVLN